MFDAAVNIAFRSNHIKLQTRGSCMLRPFPLFTIALRSLFTLLSLLAKVPTRKEIML